MNNKSRKRMRDVVRMFESSFYTRTRVLAEAKETKPWWYVRATMTKSTDDPYMEFFEWRNRLETYIEEKGFGISDGHGQSLGDKPEFDVWWWTQDVDTLLNEVAAYVQREKRGLAVRFSTLLSAPRTEGPMGALPSAYIERQKHK